MFSQPAVRAITYPNSSRYYCQRISRRRGVYAARISGKLQFPPDRKAQEAFLGDARIYRFDSGAAESIQVDPTSERRSQSSGSTAMSRSRSVIPRSSLLIANPRVRTVRTPDTTRVTAAADVTRTGTSRESRIRKARPRAANQ